MGFDILAHSRITLAGRYLNTQPGRFGNAARIKFAAVFIYAIFDRGKASGGEIFFPAFNDRNAFEPGHKSLTQSDNARYFRTNSSPEAHFCADLLQTLFISRKICTRWLSIDKKSPAQGRAIQGEVLIIQLLASQYSPVSDNPVVLLVQSRPIKKFDVLRFHLKILRKQGLNFRDIQNLIVPLVQFDYTAVFVRDMLLAGT